MAKGDQTRLLKTTTEYRGSTTTVTLDDDLQTTLSANQNYLIEGFFRHGGETGYEPLRINFRAPGGATGWYAWSQHGVDVTDNGAGGIALATDGAALATETTASVAALALFSVFDGFVSTGGSPSLGGTFGLRWAQRVSSGSPGGDPSFIAEGSWLILTEVGSPIN